MKRFNAIDVPETLADVCDPRRMALLVYDMQVGICSQVKTGAAITQGCVEAVSAARAAGMRIVHSRHLSAPKAWMGATQMRMALAWQRKDDPEAVSPWFLRDAPGTQIVPELAPQPEDLVIDKLAMSAFEGTPLAFALRDCGIQALAICGIATEIGIEPTARHAADLGIIPVLIADICGAGHPEAAERSLDSLRFAGDAMITDLATFSQTLNAARSRAGALTAV